MKKKEVDVDSSQKKEFEIDWASAMNEDGDGKVELEIVSHSPPPQTESYKSLTDRVLDEKIERSKANLITLGPNLPDNGERIRLNLASLEEEKLRRAKEGAANAKYIHSTSSGPNVFAQGNTSSKQGNSDSKEVRRSTFAAVFSKPKTEILSPKAFSKELEDLGCGSRKQKADRKTVTRSSNEWRMLPVIDKAEHSEKKFYSGVKGSKGNQISKESYGKRKAKESSSYSLLDEDDNEPIGHETPREWSWEEVPSSSSRRRKKSDGTVIYLDEEEPQPSTVAEQADELPEGLPEDICYPSSDDPNFVQVCLKDLECLAPREFLTSPVMNFYIRFLQQQHVSSSNQISANCHFFNTYFYKKLNEAVTYKGDDKDAFFVKFRRWWKGVDLFCKAYIFIPIHEDLHWSLVIVCIPDKEDESGLTILHLDSLGLHSRRSIVENVKRFLKDEWNYLKQDDDYSLDLPISEKIWRNFPRRISEADIQVPQQKNDFDCGPFVLFFIERFIEEAPQRLKRKDLRMFDKQWFRPDEASALRIKIRNTLIDLFRVSNQKDCQNDQADLTCIEAKPI
ncbi:Ubiquitin-like-specific protease 1D [Cardamine amara subsp. amara]|uniref:Ubiquitin-like-specific protease 1D n=1 Tax=Cardamine amara subsp. amara TaxID=228776 RepID=A0ABD0ZDG3_CARAN